MKKYITPFYQKEILETKDIMDVSKNNFESKIISTSENKITVVGDLSHLLDD